jgi:uncharacterized lipoprotein YajG
MNRNLKTAATLAALGAAALLSGCAFVPMTVHSHYTPPANVTKAPGAEKVTVDVIVKNEKKHRHEIGVTHDGYDIPMAGIYMHVSKVFTDAIDKALQAKGFDVSQAGSPKVLVIVRNFHIHEEKHIWSTGHTGHGSMLVTVSDASGQVLYKHMVKVNHIYFLIKQDFSNMNLTSDGRSKAANILLEKMVDRLVDDSTFIATLIRSGGQPSGDYVRIPK